MDNRFHLNNSTHEDLINSIVSFIISSPARDYLLSEYLSEKFTESDRQEIIRRVKVN